ncbi:hypothetical protein RF11_11559 [Thelohanellus kitauei]|uniref:Uncharacterized protein n=1 Tax=Thelohanellus kitauei TaxID=669202 RepID=A0A0C2JVW9_THEKT|nr:hypothetical protein RF11_11559 [Thelohanellus kitauei]
MHKYVFLTLTLLVHMSVSTKLEFTLEGYDISVYFGGVFNASFTPTKGTHTDFYSFYTEEMSWEPVQVDKPYVYVQGFSKDMSPGDSLIIQLTYSFDLKKGFRISQVLFDFVHKSKKRYIAG